MNLQTNPDLRAALTEILSALVDSIKVAGSLGAPAGTLYAALMAHGCTLAQFQSLMSILVQSGRVRQSGNLYFAEGGK